MSLQAWSEADGRDNQQGSRTSEEDTGARVKGARQSFATEGMGGYDAEQGVEEEGL